MDRPSESDQLLQALLSLEENEMLYQLAVDDVQRRTRALALPGDEGTYGWDLSHVPSLANEDLSGIHIRGRLRGKDLSNADLTCAQLDWVDLRDANLSGATLAFASFRGANLRGANLSEVDLSENRLVMQILCKWLRDREYIDSVDLSGADLSGADLSGADLSSKSPRDYPDRESRVYELGRLKFPFDFADPRLEKIRGANLKGANLQDADVVDAKLIGADLRDADLRVSSKMAWLGMPWIQNANLCNAKISDRWLVEISRSERHSLLVPETLPDGSFARLSDSK